MRPSPLLPALLLACLCCLPTPAQARCELAAEAAADLARWKASGFVVADRAQRNQRALALADCLGDADPQLRDGIAFEALSHWMRGKQLDGDGLRALQANLFRQLDGDDADGYRKPFAALVLSEVARTDRVEAWMTAEERARMAAAAADYLRSVRDHRGYVDGEGWRHGVAHGADWAMQLVLNRQLMPADGMSLLSAVATQVAPIDGHAYAFGEPARLARPVVFAVARGDLDQAAVDAWLAGLVAALGPLPEGGRQAAWWTRRANLENFLHTLGHMAAGEQSPTLAALAAGVRATLQKLP